MKKDKLRHIILKKLQNKKINAAIFWKLYQKVFETAAWKNAKIIAVTLNTDDEIPTYPLISKALVEGKEIVIPKTFKNRKMIFYELNTNTVLDKSKFGVWEPVDGEKIDKDSIDLIFVPGLAFCTSNKQRVGYGGGYFDCYLQDYCGNTISLAQKEQVFDNMVWKSEKFDVSVQQIIVGA